MASIEQAGFRPYEGLGTEDVSDSLVPLALWGRTAPAVLGDYVGGVANLPDPGTVTNLMLDGRIATLTTSLEAAGEHLYVILVQPQYARVIWRSLLSFESVRPTGADELWALLSEAMGWGDRLDSTDRLRLGRDVLLDWGVVRRGDGFIGARGLGA